jgi:cytochrome c
MDSSADAPALRGVVGRKAGKLDGYFFSEALAQAPHTWDATNLKAWLTNPQDLVPGAEMDFHIERAQDIDDVVAYLTTLEKQSER